MRPSGKEARVPTLIIEDLERVLDRLAPFALAESWDNVGLLVGHRTHEVHKVLVTLDLTEEVVVEAVSGGYQAIVAHHPLIFRPMNRVTDGDRQGIIVNQLIAGDVAAFACHTNLDGAPGGLCDQLADELGLVEREPLVRTPSGWMKLVGFVPPAALEAVSRAAFAAGAGVIGDYRDCSYRAVGTGSFIPTSGARPAEGAVGERSEVEEARWETVVPAGRLTAVVRAYIAAHPYEEPTFDLYPLQNVRVTWGQGRVGRLRTPAPLVSVVANLASLLGVGELAYAGRAERLVDRVAVVAGSGGSLLEETAAVSDVLITGDLRYHDAQRAIDLGLAVIQAPHFEVETWAMKRWTGVLAEHLARWHVPAVYASAAANLWRTARAGRRESGAAQGEQLFDTGDDALAAVENDRRVVLRVDGGSRGNPGPAAIGVVVEDAEGRVLEEISDRIGHTTNNVAEYQALITGLETVLDRGARYVRVLSDSELIVRQLRREYKVRDPELQELYHAAVGLVSRFKRVDIKHVPREENKAADLLVNKALDAS